MKRLAILFLLLGGLLASAIGQTPTGTQARNSTPGVKHGSGKFNSKHKSSGATKAVISVVTTSSGTTTTGGANITIHKCFGATEGTSGNGSFECLGKPSNTVPSNVDFQICSYTTGATSCSGQTVYETIHDAIGSNDKGDQISTFSYSAGTYLVCEATVASGFTADPRASTQGGSNEFRAGPLCIGVTLGSQNAEAQFLNIEIPPPSSSSSSSHSNSSSVSQSVSSSSSNSSSSSSSVSQSVSSSSSSSSQSGSNSASQSLALPPSW